MLYMFFTFISSNFHICISEVFQINLQSVGPQHPRKTQGQTIEPCQVLHIVPFPKFTVDDA